MVEKRNLNSGMQWLHVRRASAGTDALYPFNLYVYPPGEGTERDLRQGLPRGHPVWERNCVSAMQRNMSSHLSVLLSRPDTPVLGLAARDRWQWAVLGVVLIGATMSALDINIVNIALPTIKRQFGVGLSLIEWVSIAYMIVLAVTLPVVGRLADIYGRSRLYNVGFGVFIFGSALCGLAPDAMVLILARALQALGAGLLQANSVALVTQVFRSRELGRALGIQAAVQAMAMALGPFVGAMIIVLVGWRAIFFVNVPIGIVGGVLAHYVLPRYHPASKGQEIDSRGIILFVAALLGVAVAVNSAQAQGWGAPSVLAELALTLVCLPLFLVVEGKVESPTIDLSLFRHYELVAGNVTAFLAYYALFTTLFLLPFYFEDVLGYTTTLSGIMLVPVPLAMAVLAPFAGSACGRFGAHALTMAGSAMLVIGSFVLIFTSSARQPLFLVAAMLIVGAGLGIFTPANNRATMGATPADKLGVMGGLLNMMRSLGMIFGIDISGMLFLAAANHHPDAAASSKVTLSFLSKPAFMTGFHTVMATLAGIALLAVLVSLFRHDEKTRASAPSAAPMELL